MLRMEVHTRMTRNDRIATDLDSAQADGALRSWYCYSPEGERRWVLELAGFGTRSYSTREVEAYLTGHQQATTAWAAEVAAGAEREAREPDNSQAAIDARMLANRQLFAKWDREGVVVEDIEPGTPEWDASEVALAEQRRRGL